MKDSLYFRELLKILSLNKDIINLEDEIKIAISYYRNSKIPYTLNDITKEELLFIQKVVERRKKREPLQYIIGKWDFYNREFKVDSRALIPRQETEILIEYIVDYIRRKNIDNLNGLDLGCGSGIIGITLLKELYNLNIQMIASDISDAALELTRENAQIILDNEFLQKIQFIKSDLFQNLDTQFDFIVSNPPYVEERIKGTLQKELLYEPQNALYSGDDGMYILSQLPKLFKEHLSNNGFFIVEIGSSQGDILKKSFEKEGFTNLQIIKDYNLRDRFIFGEKHV